MPLSAEPHVLVEANLGQGVVSAPLSKYRFGHVRVCRPHALTPQDRAAIVQFMISHIGLTYDTRNVVDLMRYLFPPADPGAMAAARPRPRVRSPTRAICSTRIAHAFQRSAIPSCNTPNGATTIAK